MRYEKEHKQRTREKVVKEASAAFRLHGPDNIGVVSLMSKAGLTHGGFYAHFKSKDELILAAIAHMFDDQHARFVSLQEGVAPDIALINYIDTYLSPLHREHRDKGCPVVALSGDVSRMSATIRKGFDAGVSRMIQEIASVIGKLNAVDPDALAISMVTEMVGAMVMARAVDDLTLSDKILETAKHNIKKLIKPEQ
jgi:TetR/AcrR family transcriptional repressor of nem operon